MEFSAEVRKIIEPFYARMDSIDENIAQISTMVSSIINGEINDSAANNKTSGGSEEIKG